MYALLPYTYKFSRDVIFTDYFRGSFVITPCTSSVLQKFQGFKFRG